MEESDCERDETPQPMKKRKVACKEHRKTRGHPPAPQESLPSLSAFEADVLDTYCLPEKLKAVSRSILRFYFRSLKLDTSNDGQSICSGSGSSEPSLSLSSGHQQDAASKKIKRARRRTRPNLHTLTMSSFQSLLSTLSAPPPRTAVLFPRNTLLFFSFFQVSGTALDTTSHTPHLFSSKSTSLPGVAAFSSCRKAHTFPSWSQTTASFCGELHMIT